MINDFRDKLVGNSTITEELDGKVFPVISPLGDTIPVIIYTVDGGLSGLYTDSIADYKSSDITLDIYTENYNQLQVIKEAVITEFHGFKGTMGETVVRDCTIEDINEALDSQDSSVFRAIVSINLDYI